ncbi:MAG: hypothetical protein RIS80_456, partial [Actinomycetota bacterium]
GADHVYRMDFAQMIEAHIASGRGVTVAAIRQPMSLANQFGVIEVDAKDPNKIAAFKEKPASPKGLPDSPNEVLASMGTAGLPQRSARFDGKLRVHRIRVD